MQTLCILYSVHFKFPTFPSNVPSQPSVQEVFKDCNLLGYNITYNINNPWKTLHIIVSLIGIRILYMSQSISSSRIFRALRAVGLNQKLGQQQSVANLATIRCLLTKSWVKQSASMTRYNTTPAENMSVFCVCFVIPSLSSGARCGYLLVCSVCSVHESRYLLPSSIMWLLYQSRLAQSELELPIHQMYMWNPVYF